jgi:hypothetical protein
MNAPSIHEKTLDLCLGNISYKFSFLFFYGIDAPPLSNLEFSFETANLIVVWEDPLDGGKPVTWLLRIQDNTTTKETSKYFDAPSGIQTMMPVVEDLEDSTCFELRAVTAVLSSRASAQSTVWPSYCYWISARVFRLYVCVCVHLSVTHWHRLLLYNKRAPVSVYQALTF